MVIDIPSKHRKTNLLKTSSLRTLRNLLSPQKDYSNCFGCGDNFWWKQDVSIAFKKPAQKEFDWSGEEDFSPEYENYYIVPHEDTNLIVYRHGVAICRECFAKKSEKELIEVFENAKKNWLRNKTNPEEIERINKYELFLPIRTIKGTFKKEVSAKISSLNKLFKGTTHC